DVAELRVAVAREDAQRVLDVGAVDGVALLEEPVELREHAARELDLERVADQGKRELALEELHVLVVLAEQLAEERGVGEMEDGRGGGGLDQGGQRLPAPRSP